MKARSLDAPWDEDEYPYVLYAGRFKIIGLFVDCIYQNHALCEWSCGDKFVFNKKTIQKHVPQIAWDQEKRINYYDLPEGLLKKLISQSSYE